ncbi:MAG: hypothetical protein WCJ49_03640 [Deltaproteobacteria bacterium]
MKKKILGVCFIVFFFLQVFAASAEEQIISGMPIKIGDSIIQVQKSFNTNIEPSVMESKLSSGKERTELRLRTKGVWIFFDKNNMVATIRLEAPFEGSFKGIKIGDNAKLLEEKWGKPVKKVKWGRSDNYLYYPDDNYGVKFSFDEEDMIDIVFVSK